MNNVVPLKQITIQMLDNDAAEIGRLYRKGCEGLVDSVVSFVEAGWHLICKKAGVPHGAWMSWIATNADALGFNDHRTATRLMRATRTAQRKANWTPASNMGIDAISAVKISRDMWGHTETVQAKIISKSVPASTKKRSPLQRMVDLPRGDEISKVFTNKNAAWGIMKMLEEPGCREIWDMMVQCYDAGFLRDSSYYPNGAHDICSLRILFPQAQRAFAGKFNMRKKSARDYVRNIILPVAMANRDKVAADHEALAFLVARAGTTASLSPVPAPAPSSPPPVSTETTEDATAAAERLEQHKKWVDPEFTGTHVEFVDKYGHVQTHTAEQYATMRFGDWAAYMKSLAKQARDLPPLPTRPVDLNWLRSPEPKDVDKMAEALKYLRPLMAEAEAMLVKAEINVKRIRPGP